MTKKYEIHPKTAKEALDKWIKGDIINVVEMGGLGPGYEQAIWIGVFKTIQYMLGKDIKTWEEDGEYTSQSDKDLSAGIKGLDLSGVQAGSIKSIVYKVFSKGWRETMKTIPKDRKIMVSKNFPKWE